MAGQVLWTFMAGLCISVTLNMLPEHIVRAGIIAAAGRFIFLLTVAGGFGKIVGVFAAAFGVALMAHVFARVFRAPVIVFLVPGIITIVPGVEAYQMVLAIVTDRQEMAGMYGLQVIKIAGMIALALFIVDTFFKIFSIQRHYFTDKT